MKFVDSFVLNMCSKLIFCSKIAQKGKRFLEVAYKNLKKVAPKAKRCRTQSGKA